jgi:sulfopyruvate decarboxylase subunit beta
MKRKECLASILPELSECTVVTIMGAVAAELHSLGHRPGFFYLQHAMGLAPSIGLGIAMTRPERRVVVLDGDGSLLMNLGGLTTLAHQAPGNLTHIVFDNASFVSIGGHPTPTSHGVDLPAAARAAGIRRVQSVTALDEFIAAARDAITSEELSCLVAKVEADVVASFAMDLHLLENRFEFARHLRPAAPGGGVR